VISRSAIKFILGFTVKRGFNAVLHDLTQAEKFISTIMKNGANEINSIHFRSSKALELRDQARIKAVMYLSFLSHSFLISL
jgi:uncharacterized protein YggE